MEDVNITNVLRTQPLELAEWLSTHILNVRLPDINSNYTLNIQKDVMPLLSTIANNIAFVTELYNICIGAKAPWTANKKVPELKAQAEMTITTLGAHIDILYRTLQALDSMRESASRLMTGANQNNRFTMGQ